MTEPEERDPAHRPRSMDLAAVTWVVVGAGMLVFLLVNIISGVDPAAPTNSAALFGGLTVLWCAKNLRMGWRGPRIFLTLVAPVLAYSAAALLMLLLLGHADALPALVVIALGLLAITGTVLMFRPDANAFVREMTRR
ncbi:hypothetical protein NLX83_37300 [Allokutzneria sp. A3M-2-11 16]|uniref:hypothetical protein n=1 Tax=Allokutzneria sp. A3M-2-11 16 TaxID=2962043 RepID=UPI0020B846A7|nr:hypothetical protein [Allokutzneria sp. A3M-2-11 16]MCP3804938.1 hypothetical protein [Allokutzneria sp. A3M-2-11 16]